MQHSLARQVTGRLALAIGVSLLATLTVSVWLSKEGGEKARAEQLRDARDHFSHRIPEWEATWEANALGIKVRIEYARLLETRANRAERLVSYFAAQGGSTIFTGVLLVDARREPVVVLPATRRGFQRARELRGSKGWYYDADDRTLYRVYYQPVWLGNDGNGGLYLFRPIDNALLAESVYPYTDVFLVREQRVIASSFGTSGIVQGEDYLRSAGLQPGNSVRWGNDGAPIDGQPEPRLLIRRNVRDPLSLMGTVLPAVLGAAVIMLLGWLALGGWLATMARRILALGEASERFVAEATISPRVETSLRAARGDRPDELSAVADVIDRLMRDTLRHAAEMEKRNRAMRESERRFRDLAELSSDWYWEQDRNLRFTVMSVGLDEKANLSARTTLGMYRWELPIVGMSEAQWTEHKRVLSERKPFDMTYQIRNDAGELRWFHIRGRPVFTEEGEFKGYRGTGSDQTERMHAERALRESETRYRLLFEANPHPMWVCDPETAAFLAANDAAVEHYGYTREEFLGMTLGDLFARGEETELPLGSMDYFEGAYRHRKKSGEMILVELVAHVFDYAGRRAQLVTAQDVTARKTAEARIQHLAYYDALTGLPNRSLLQDRVTQILGLADRDGSPATLLFIDLDRFKNINDSLGHDVGDQLLQATATRLQTAVREVDTVSRFGGDEFVILLPETGADGAAHAAGKILDLFTETFETDGYRLNITASIGIATFPGDGRDFHMLVRNADTAMYHAKDSGRNNYQFFAAEMNAVVLERLVLEHGLRQALERGQFELLYQPQVSIASGAVIGVEALLRWRHPDWGLVMPARFIAVAEDSNLIRDIGEWVLREACRQNREWQDAGLPPIRMAVNVSAVQFRNELDETVRRALEESRLAAQWLELELTESMMTNTGAPVLRTMGRLEALGVNLTIDDFGTGYSSLSQLKRVPIGRLKIDQSFVRDIINDSDDRAIVRAVIQMGRSMQLAVVAEGVENGEQAEWLRREGCFEAQGFHYCRPLPAAECRQFLEASLSS